MKHLLSWYNGLNEITLNDIIEFHYRFESIHPFQDGNGRVGRLVMFQQCLSRNIMPFIIEVSYKAFYYRGLAEYKNDKNWLLDTCLSMQDNYNITVNRLLNTNF